VRKEEQKSNLDEAADRQNLKQLCVKQRVCSALVKFTQFIARVGLGFYDRLARLSTSEEKK
jgi:hypothetical protein